MIEQQKPSVATLLPDLNELGRAYYRVGFTFNHSTQIDQVLSAINGLGYIAGSAAAWCCVINGMEYGDIDVFATSVDNAAAIVERLSGGYVLIAENDVAITMLSRAYAKEYKQVQVIKPRETWRTFPQDIVMAFDFDLSSVVLLDTDLALYHIDIFNIWAKILRMNNPLRTLKRVLKYHKRGVEFSDYELLKMFRFWQELTPERQNSLVSDADTEGAMSTQNDGSNNWTDDDEWDGE